MEIREVQLVTGEKIYLPDEKLIEKDWEEDFRPFKSELNKMRRINEYLDGTKGYSGDEKAYFISYYGKSTLIRAFTKDDRKWLIIYQVYFLQNILFQAKPTAKEDIARKLKNIIDQVTPTKLSLRDIQQVRTISSRNYLSQKYKKDFARLTDEGKAVLASYYMDQSGISRRPVLDYYRKILEELSFALDEHKYYQEENKKITQTEKDLKSVLPGDKSKGPGLGFLEQKTIKEIQKKKTKADNFLLMAVKLEDKRLISELSHYKEVFTIKMKKKHSGSKK